ncbi:Hybrid sensor histidine kinase/response regulator [Burkholderia sp. 8Y]|uniref:hybrid sensor histidine kinase/response regulator n=1 Tax=Burkholderia sp. 8Y TaxID=2653133 RepID=UPI0012F1DF62|nr:ATP-binding protein [Burkholderia sp. 8Y]VXC84329.1 Hybrid sensor histidine kinase/response regulator [Burkholderia sp. 8Y]
MTDYRLRPHLESPEETLDRLRRAVEAADVGTFYCPLPPDRLYWNARAKELFWLPPSTPDSEINIDLLFRIMHPDDRERVRAAMEECIASGDSYDVEYRAVSPEGEVRWIRAKGSACFDGAGQALRLDGITIDISLQKRLEAERNALIESERLQRLAAETASKAKDNFIAAVSHELRTPLTSILAWADLIEHAPEDSGFVKNGISVIRRNVTTQARLVDDLLDTSRISNGKFTVDRTPIAVADCLNAALQDIRPIADKKGIFVADLIAENVQVFGDGARLRQVFANLLNNAIKHTEPGGKILPSLVVVGDTVKISIADTGAGIPPDRLAQIFEPFVQVENPVMRDRRGLGLGLAIARSIVLMHGGAITAHSGGLGAGATFTVELPLAGRPSATPSLSEDILGESAIKGTTVLIVEDDADAREALALTLQIESIGVQVASGVEDALRVIPESPPDIIVSDLGLPDGNGYEFMRALRDRGVQIPAIALTGHVRPDDEQKAKDAGFDVYLGKPVDPAKLLEAIAKVLRD